MQPPLRMLGLLMLMFSLCHADSRCTPDILTLEPPEILGKYGESVTINCTSPDEIHDGIHWRVGNTTSPVEMDNGFVLWELQLSDWTVTAECIIERIEGYTCSKELEITVYDMPQQPIVFPTKYSVPLEGTPYVLQCDVNDVAPVENLTVRWYRDDQIIKTDFFTNATKTPVTESSTLEVNISREDNGAQFRCEAQLDFGLRGSLPPIVSDTHNVSVHYAPELKNKTEDVYVNDYSDVSLSCEAEGQPLPVFHWTCDGLNVSGNMNNLNISEVRTSTTCYCTAKNYLGNRTKEIHVHVMKSTTTALPAAPAAPTSITTPESTTPRGCPIVLTPAEIVVKFGDTASANCSTSEDVVGMGWEATSGGTGFEDGPSVEWRVESVKAWAINATCYITRKDNTQCNSSVTVTVYKTPDSVTVSPSDPGPMMEGEEYELDCDIKNVAPMQKLKVNWYRDDNLVHVAEFKGISQTPESVISTLTVTPESDHNGALYRCEAELQLGPMGPDQIIPTVTSSPFTADVHYKPVIDCPVHYPGVEHQFSLDMVPCKADGNPPPAVQWYYEGELVNASVPLIRNKTGRYTAEVVNDRGRSSTSLDITIEYGPLFDCDSNYDIEEKGKLPCEPEGEPKPHITWYKDGKKTAPPQHWTKDHSGKYLLQATNSHGTANHTLTLNILYKPVIDCPVHYPGVEHQFSLDMVPCKADGNPPPAVQWYYEGELVNASVPLIRNKAGRYTSEVVNDRGRSSTSLDITIEYGPLFDCDSNYDIEEKGKLPCEPKGEPKPQITWYKDGKKIVPPQDWTKDHSGKYLLQATNSHGKANHTLTLNILYLPVFKEESSHLELSPGQNVTLNCSADGNPLPEVRWIFSSAVNVRSATRGSQKSITIIEATSTNTGVYNCTATNRVGKVTKSVTLVMKGQSSRVSLKSFWWVLLILLVALILLLLFVAYNQSKKHGQYSFIPDRANESSNIPMTPQSNGVHT